MARSLRCPLPAAPVLGAALAVALPGTALATTTVTVRSPGATSGPIAANSESASSASSANCRTGGDTNDIVSGVGISQTVGTGSAQSNLHVKGIVPFDGIAEYVAANSYTPGVVDTDATQARAVGGTGGTVDGPLTATGNTGGVEISGYTISGPTAVLNNRGGGPHPGDTAPAFTVNRVRGLLTCLGNSPALRQTGNTVTGIRLGQCR